ncbi:MAG: hypothetical protein IPH34_12870 [Chitinophagaceae bacterium]|nr:hypothetical protein [Chitinophagaceae bacterium]MBK8312239.1 hypothetical protein [Chitinophagaceae bacterium]MBK8608192.1 hypothetical protein [Chitinophagaceae bacterium]MBP6476399.1 hypothetical protein [Chitinophagaceae bacterium]MBP7108314.1 hypothetical protein [Chitinophagaceae bacterium]
MKKNNFKYKWFVLALFSTLSQVSWAQQIAIDRGLKLEGIWCFPLVTDSNQYLFLPDQSMLGTNNKNEPQFSFIRYVNPTAVSNSGTDNSLVDAGGGGVLHFLVTYNTDEKKIAKAQERLREKLNNDEAQIKGPIIFKEGRYALISSIINPDNGQSEKKLLAMGAAPVLQGSKIALSFELDPQRSKLLLESFKTNTPDVSIVFDLTFSGLLDAYNAKMTVDWAEVQKYEKIGGGVQIYFVSAELEKIYEELRRTSAIKLDVVGEDSRMQKIVDEAYAKVTEMMFQRVQPEQVPATDQNSLAGMLGSVLGSSGGGGSGSGFPLGAHFGYKRKDIKMSGKSVLDFSSRNATERHHYITFNMGDLFKKYGADSNYFRTISLYDPEFQIRQIFVGIDGSIIPEFEKMINNVTITLRKKHQNGSSTFKEVIIKKGTLESNKELMMTYNSVGDLDREKWLQYEYKAQFNFLGGKTYQTDWKQQSNSMINIFVPYIRKIIKVDAEQEVLVQKNVRAITVKIDYPFLGDIHTKEFTVRPGEDLTKKSFEVTLPNGQYDYKYNIRWRFKNNTERIYNGVNDTEILFIDNIPDS